MSHQVPRSKRNVRVGTWLVAPNKFLTPGQVAVLRASLQIARQQGVVQCDGLAIRNAVLVELLLGTGLRVSEACALWVGDLYLGDENADLAVRNGKGGKARMVAISGRLAACLQDYLKTKAVAGARNRSKEPLFRSERGGPLSRSAVHRIWKGILPSAGLPTTWGVYATRDARPSAHPTSSWALERFDDHRLRQPSRRGRSARGRKGLGGVDNVDDVGTQWASGGNAFPRVRPQRSAQGVRRRTLRRVVCGLRIRVGLAHLDLGWLVQLVVGNEHHARAPAAESADHLWRTPSA
jgi:hypothetical protein